MTWKELYRRRLPYSSSIFEDGTIYPISDTEHVIYYSEKEEALKGNLLISPLVEQEVPDYYFWIEPEELVHSSKVCNCSIQDLMYRGCKCGGV